MKLEASPNQSGSREPHANLQIWCDPQDDQPVKSQLLVRTWLRARSTDPAHYQRGKFVLTRIDARLPQQNLAISETPEEEVPPMGLIEDVAKTHRPILGSDIPLLVFRVFRHFSAGYVEEMLGRGAGVVFQGGGRELGKEAGNMLYKPDATEYLRDVCQFVRDSRIGILIPREVSAKLLVVDLDECITCAGMDPVGKRICQFEVGFVAGVAEILIKKKPKAYETKCNANGEGTCQVTVELE